MVTRPSADTARPSRKASEMSLFVAVPLGSNTAVVMVAPSQGMKTRPPP